MRARLELVLRSLLCVLAALTLTSSLTKVASAKQGTTVGSTCKDAVVKAETVAKSRKLSYRLEVTSSEQSDFSGALHGTYVAFNIIYKLNIMGGSSPGIIKFTPVFDGNSCRVESSKSEEADEIVRGLKKKKGK